MVNDTPVSIVSWNEQGKLLSELSINNGKRSGIVIDWYESGTEKIGSRVSKRQSD